MWLKNIENNMWFYDYQKSVITLEKNGYFINDKKSAEWLLYNDIYNAEVDMINYVKGSSLVHPDKVFLDIGSHLGMWAWNIAPYFKKTYAFEPNRKVYNYLCGNIALKDLSDKIETHNIGISDKKDVLNYYKRDHVWNGQEGMNGFLDVKTVGVDGVEVQKIPVTTLDSFNINDVGFIKIDVEGFEKNVIEGGIRTIVKSNYPPILFESWYPGKEPWDTNEVIDLRKDLLLTLEKLGYNTFVEWMSEGEMILATKQNESKGTSYTKLDHKTTVSLSEHFNQLEKYRK